MASVNKVIVLGNLGRDPELRHTTGGKAVATLSVATNEHWTDQSGERQERTEWHRIVVWGRPAENCAQYLAKGRSVFVEGRLQTRKWEDRDGNDRYTTEIVADSVQFLGSGSGAGDHGGFGDLPVESSGAAAPPAESSGAAAPPADDIPF
jgi:single-strand DNA-binding protein